MSAVAFDMSIILVLSLATYFKDKKVRHRFIFLLSAVCAVVEIGAFLFANLMPLESGAAYPVHAFMTFLWLRGQGSDAYRPGASFRGPSG